MTKQIFALVLALAVAGCGGGGSDPIPPVAAPAPATGFTFGTSSMRLTANDYSGWGVCSLTVNGYEYIDGYDHGRCLQSAVSFDGMGEAFNPTEVGNYPDGLLPNPSTSQGTAQSDENRMTSAVEMAFWQGGRSKHVLRKEVTVGVLGKNIIEHKIDFEIPASETHSAGQFEILTGYMPPAFSKFSTYDPATGIEGELTDGPGEQAKPVIFCTQDDRCIGAYSPQELTGGGYGRWRFIGDKCMTKAGATGCVKWNMVARYDNPRGTYRFNVYTTVGTLTEVKANLTLLRGASQ